MSISKMTLNSLAIVATTFARMAISISAILALAGCGVIVPGTPWTKEDKDGPILLGDQRAMILSRCVVVPAFMRKGPWETAFADHRNEKIRWMDIRKKIDNHLNKIPSLAPWVHELRNDGTCCAMLERRVIPYTIPYKLHILTISPIVVLVMPYPNYHPGDCIGTPAGGCIRSERTDAAYFYRDDIEVVPGEFVFSPELPAMATTLIRSDAERFEVQLPDSRLQLVAEKGRWNIHRYSRDRKQ